LVKTEQTLFRGWVWGEDEIDIMSDMFIEKYLYTYSWVDVNKTAHNAKVN